MKAKKSFLKSAIFSFLSIILLSCGSTNVSQEPESPSVEEASQSPLQEELPQEAKNQENLQENKAEENQADLGLEQSPFLPENLENSENQERNQPSLENENPQINENIAEELAEEKSSEEGSTEEAADKSEINTSEGNSSDFDQNGNDEDGIKSQEDEAKAEAPKDEEDFTEKVSDEDSYLAKETGNAPMTDERGKISDYFIFDEPEVLVHDLPETQEEEKKEEPQILQDSEKTEHAEDSVNTVISENSENTPQINQEKISEPNFSVATAENSLSKAPIVPSKEAGGEVKGENQASKEEIPLTEEKKPEETESIMPSRSVTVKINQYLDVTYPGKGWTYIGEENKKDIFNYFGRKLAAKNTTFSLRAKKAGETFLHFYKNDALTGEYIDDYLKVTVEDKKSTGRVKAPSYADIVPAKPQRRIDRANETLNQEKNMSLPENEAKSPEKTQATKGKNTDSERARNSKTDDGKKAETKKNETKNQQESSPRATAAKNTAANLSSTPLSNVESDIKTVIQNTEGKNSEKTTAGQSSQEARANSEPKAKENTRKQPETEPSIISPISSESEITVDESNPVLMERSSQSRLEGDSDESLLEKAKKDFADKKYADALREAEEYYNNASTRLDEALFLLGQISESNSNVKDIRFAVDSYDMLVKRFPASKYWKEAKQRSIYLKRFYIDIR
ncbi:hypothetical protein [uncultured Treponema sp.]|uniref:hypothetical protein n=1 Tax=uncultured Treponema sp. TaxID=162155 RepID=UPI0025DA0836|nr:hypothetical protein [uncultured Treponema sp.]